ncbi:MAG TPA: DUF4010 domain-containing protein, partial [Povalibacter sp.]
YRHTRDEDPGMTTEIAQLGVLLLGGLAMRQPQMAAGLGVAIAILLASRSQLHRWVHNALTDMEIRDGLLLAAAALIILPLTPTGAVDPWNVIYPRKLWTLAVVVMALNGLGYIALRVLGPKIGLVLAGFFSGFVSSTATIGAMGSRVRNHPELRNGAVAGAAISSVASLLQLAIVIGLVSVPLLQTLALPLLAAGAMTLVYAALFTIRSARGCNRCDITRPAIRSEGGADFRRGDQHHTRGISSPHTLARKQWPVTRGVDQRPRRCARAGDFRCIPRSEHQCDRRHRRTRSTLRPDSQWPQQSGDCLFARRSPLWN